MVGTYQDINGLHGFSLAGNTFTDIPIPMGGKDLQALGINYQGQIVGTYKSTLTNADLSFLYQAGTETQIYPCGVDVPVGGDLAVTAINDNGVLSRAMTCLTTPRCSCPA